MIRRLVLGLMGAAGSKLEKALGDQFPEGERYFGFENFGNTCYCNSVLQVPLISLSLLLVIPFISNSIFPLLISYGFVELLMFMLKRLHLLYYILRIYD